MLVIAYHVATVIYYIAIAFFAKRTVHHFINGADELAMRLTHHKLFNTRTFGKNWYRITFITGINKIIM